MKQRNLVIWGIVITTMLLVSCKRDGLTKAEVERVLSGGENEIMTLFTVNNRSDSLLLRQNARNVKIKHIQSETVQYLKSRMLATVNDPSNPGVGIAAPQVGISTSMIYVQRLDKVNQPFEIYFNPLITAYGDSLKTGSEGCLSVPDLRGDVCRSKKIKISYNDSLGNFVEEEIKGFTAVIFQHEIDHINGVLYYDRISDGYTALVKDTY